MSEEARKMDGSMNWGFVAFIDVLGFKGLWSREIKPEEVLSALEHAKSETETLIQQQNESDFVELWEASQIQVRAFSDTIAILAPMPPVPRVCEQNIMELGFDYESSYHATRRYMMLRQLVIMTSKVITGAASKSPPFLYRGCISAGEFTSNDFAFVGEAVDEAGSYFEAAEGAFVFLTPSAKRVFDGRPGLLSMAMFPYFVSYAIPLKSGEKLSTFALNPLLYTKDMKPEDVSNSFMSVLSANPSNESVRKKLKNTSDFLDFLRKDWIVRGTAGWE